MKRWIKRNQIVLSVFYIIVILLGGIAIEDYTTSLFIRLLVIEEIQGELLYIFVVLSTLISPFIIVYQRDFNKRYDIR